MRFTSSPTPRNSLYRRLAACLVPIIAAATGTGCRDVVRVYSHPPGARLMVDNHPVGTIPETGLAVDVKWWTFGENRARLAWPNGATLYADFERSIGEPNHPPHEKAPEPFPIPEG